MLLLHRSLALVLLSLRKILSIYNETKENISIMIMKIKNEKNEIYIHI